MEWNFDTNSAPKGSTKTVEFDTSKGKRQKKVFEPDWVLTASPTCRKVIHSHWIPKEKRWNGYTKDAPPIAWMYKPDHPHKQEIREA